MKPATKDTRMRRIAARLFNPSAMAGPYAIWMAIFVVAPLIFVVIFAFTNENGEATLGNIAAVGNYFPIFARSFWFAILATAICVLLGYPLAYVLANEAKSVQRVMSMLMMLPMWMNFLLRTYAWTSILANETGILARFLGIFGLPSPNIEYTNTAVIIGMVYNFLPFMVLPIYSVLVKLDRKLIEAAQDLGASPKSVFTRVVFPLSLPGVLSGVTMVFVPAVSTFAISKILGNGIDKLLGDLIEQHFKGTAYNPYVGSAISLVMMVIVLALMYVMNRFGDGEGGAISV